MRGLKLSALIGAMTLAAPSAGALAADYYVPPPPLVGHSWYLRGHIGMAAQGFRGLDHPDFETPAFFEWLDRGHFDAVPIFGVGIGVYATDLFRVDVTGQYRGNAGFTALDRYDFDSNPPDFGDGEPETWGTTRYTGEKSEWLLLANGYVDFAAWRGVTPYIGGGIGASYNTISGFVDNNEIQGGQGCGQGCQGWAPTGHKWSLAWALHAGAGI